MKLFSRFITQSSVAVVAYHGTSTGSQEDFDQRDSFIWFSTNPLDAADYGSAKVFKATLDLKNPANLEDREVQEILSQAGIEDPSDLFWLTEQGPEVRVALEAAGYDSLLTPREDLDATHYGVFYLTQILGLVTLTVEEAEKEPNL